MDIKRTILWVIFSLAVVLLFDNWQRANGHQSMFFPTPQTATTTAAAPGSTPAGDVPSNASTAAAAGSQAAPATGAASQA
ncbi:membrane protein insertase YidC, partial [Legionella pneumophila]